MPTDRAGAGGRGKDDLQHDGGGAGHASQKSKKDLDRELDKALQELVPVFRSAGDFAAHGDRARRRPQGQTLSATAFESAAAGPAPRPAAGGAVCGRTSGDLTHPANRGCSDLIRRNPA